MKKTTPWQGRATLLLALGLSLAACSQAPSPETSANDPYAGGVSYPWTDQTPATSDPYASGISYPWTGPSAASLQPAGLSGDNSLSDLSWTPGSAANAWGPIELNRSNGEKNSGDGRTLTIGGQSFPKGLGMHANGEVSYATGGSCSTFTATVGIDDEVGDRGSVVFEVWDGTTTRLYATPILRGSDPPFNLTVPLTRPDGSAVRDLRLVVRDAGDGISYDHADWANPTLSCSATPPSGDVFVSDLDWNTPSNGWGPIEQDLSNGEKGLADGRTLTIGGQSFPKGLGMHANGSVTYLLGGRCSTFTASVGVDDEVGDRGSVVFQVFGDGTKLYDSGVRRGTDGPQALNVNVSGVQQLKLVVTDAGDSISYDHADWANAKLSCSSDTTPPATPSGLTATGTPDGITLDWSDNSEADLAGYKVYGSASPNGPFQLLTPQPIQQSAWTDTSVPPGATEYYQVVAVDSSGNASAPASVSATRLSGSTAAKIEIENLDGTPWNDRLVFSRIGSLASPPSNGVHNLVTLRVKNTGAATLRISSLPIQDTWTLDPAITLPLDIPPGGSADLRLRFVAETTKAHFGTLTINSNDPATPSLAVQLAGLWQSQSENNQEPSTLQIRDAFGFKNSLLGGEASLNQKGLVRAQGDEVLSPYWQRADETQPVVVRQLAAYHTQGNTATLNWHAKGSNTLNTVFTHAGIDGQTVLPRLNGSSTQLAYKAFTPTAKTFGFNVDSSEWSDPTKNRQGPDLTAGCSGPCGQHIRFYTVRDRAGVLIPNTYFVIMDYSGINYDYNDNIYLISNIKPAPILINVGGPAFTDPDGNVWTADKYSYTDQNGAQRTYTYYTPSNAISQPSSPTSVDILNTTNDVLYRTYRHNTLDTPLDSRVMIFDIPVNNGTYQVKLHFAELYWNEPGKRLFDVSVEGVPKLTNFDIWAQAGGKNTALVVPINNVQVADGRLTIQLKARVDFPDLSGIEVTR
ncbi:NPCBM/NEW2 domain-containing protein [Deinococcus sp. DB0503]|uniref:NPCBM/NEW2 domain-containing protein n=1 Tax=Deinococcus sp. DB0503 TaxID=2479203 RepID=UPI0018E054AE|nr:NPCBM/NEW2 domain-containing protein [Deinococcus sp. DB0503]MBI0446275.1 glycosyl hydrolase [Deinococcus sp. DB0503]